MKEEDRKSIHIPEIYRILDGRLGYYIIMEYIQGLTIGQLYRGIDWSPSALGLPSPGVQVTVSLLGHSAVS